MYIDISDKIIGLIITVIGGLIVLIIPKLFSKIYKYCKDKKMEKEKIKDAIDKSSLNFVKSSDFIQTKGQYKNPSDSVLVESDNSSSFILVDKLLNEIFNNQNTDEKKRYAILGGTGMGKTTFIASFFYKYKNFYKFKKSPFPIYVKYLGNNDVLEEIRILSKSPVDESILVLDALDENVEAASNTEGFFEKLYRLTQSFKVVIITSRTQFFPNKKSEPHKVEHLPNGYFYDSLYWQIYYISPLDYESVIDILRNKYLVNPKKFSEAKKIIDKSNDLFARPLILKHIDYLLNISNNKNLSLTEIYYTIIDKWIERECSRNKLNKSDLFSFSKKIALFMYEKWNSKEAPCIPYDQFNDFLKEYGFSTKIKLFERNSLLNRNNNGDIKFSHKSFWEFFLAVVSFENPYKSFNSVGLEGAVNFSKELFDLYLKDVYFEYIDYYKPDFIIYKNFLDTELIEAIDQCKIYLSDSTKNKESLPILFYKLSNMIIRRFPFQYEESLRIMFHLAETVNVIQNGYLNSIESNYSELNTLIFRSVDILKDTDDLLNIIQKCYFNNCNFNDNLIKILALFDNIINWIHSGTSLSKAYFYYPFRIKTEYIVYPFLSFLNKNKEFLDNVFRYSFVSIGLGFIDDNKFWSFINELLQIKPKLKNLIVYREDRDIDNLIDFILKMSSHFHFNSNLNIYLSIHLNNIPLRYVINDFSSNYKREEIKECLDNILKYEISLNYLDIQKDEIK